MASASDALRTLVKGAGISFVGVMLTKVFGYIYQIVAANALGSDLYGVLSLGMMAFSVITSLVMLGIPSSVQRFIPYYRNKDDEERIQGVFDFSIRVTLLTSIIISIGLFLSADFLAIQIFRSEQVASVLRVFSIAVPFCTLATVTTNIAVAFKKIRFKIYIRNITESIVKIAVTAVLLWFNYGLFGASIGFAAGWISSGILGLYLIDRKIFPFISGSINSVRERAKIVRHSAPLVLSDVFNQITSWADIFLLGYMKNSSAVGLYNAALPTATIISVIPSAIGSLATPVMTEFYSEGKIEDMAQVYKTTTKWVLMITLPMFLLMALFSKPGLKLLFSPEYLEQTVNFIGFSYSSTATALSILAFGYLASSLTGISRQIIEATSQTKYNFYLASMTGLVNIGLNLLLIPDYGVLGAAIATSFSLVTSSVASIIVVNYLTSKQPFKISMWKIFFSGLVAAVSTYFLIKALADPVPEWMLVPALAAFGVIYLGLLLLTRTLSEDDKMIIKAAERKIGVDIPYLDEVIERFS
ncbi:MAG: hypothetical protein BRC29_00810 [Nanohaloarchaea archaeon SW_7_43_1]|nr:MAG: hypothetical protein BRC29_00810 [Nanohaloarchaea archaeon SW_7_43_1]